MCINNTNIYKVIFLVILMINQEVMILERITLEDVSILSHKHIDYVLKNEKVLTKQQILEEIREFKDRIERYV